MLGFGLFGRIRVRIGPEGDKALKMGQAGRDGRMDRFPLCSTGLRPLRGRCPKNKQKEKKPYLSIFEFFVAYVASKHLYGI